MIFLRKIILAFCLLGSCFAVTACGRYSEPMPVENSGYPHTYPQR